MAELKRDESPAPWDDDLRDGFDEPVFEPAAPGRSRGPVIAAAVLVVAAAFAAYVVFMRRTEPPAQPVEPTKAVEAPEPARPLGGEAAPIVLPPLNESDAVVRELVRQLSSHPRLTAWLATDGLVRNFTVVVANIADGTEVSTLLRPLRPSGAFRVVERGGSVYIDPRSYERYTGLAEGIGALDPAGTARLYATLKPRIEEAYGELGARETFDRTLERALVRLLETPATPGLVPVEPGGRGIGYVFVDDRLEGLTPAQRQLLRMGPENARIIQTKIREVALALGIPPQRLPAAAR